MGIALRNDILAIERQACEEMHIPMLLLMEQAGVAVAERVQAHLASCRKGAQVGIICGIGNNGGDGLAAARHLIAAGIDVHLYMYGDTTNATALTKQYGDMILGMGAEIRNLRTDPVFSSFPEELTKCDLLVDALMGTGYRGPMEQDIRKIIQAINDCKLPTIAIDLPSGVDCDTGQAETAVKAMETVALIMPKPGHFLQPGGSFCGRLTVSHLALPFGWVHKRSSLEAADTTRVASIIKTRSMGAHKGEMGKTFIAAGSARYPGAALLTAQGALRAGSGLVYLLDYSRRDFSAHLPEVIPGSCLLSPEDWRSPDQILKAVAKIKNNTTLVMGPGLSDDPDVAEVVRYTVQAWASSMVLDADALNALENKTNLLTKAAGKIVITPHPGEMARLLGIPIQEVQSDRVQVARDAAEKWRCTVVLKGAGTIIATPGQRVCINTTGNPGMATGGSGDVLAGLIGGLLSQGYDSHEAAVLGVYMHGKAGDLASEKFGPIGYTPSETADMLPAAYDWIYREKMKEKSV